MNPWVLLALAIAAEVIGTTALKASEGFTRIVPSVLVALGYGAAFYLMSQALKSLEVGTVYAVWSGVGIVATAIIGLIAFRENLDAPKLIGIALIVVGVVVLQAFSKTISR
jgi:multidrug transporter EmrE-like cation transporter